MKKLHLLLLTVMGVSVNVSAQEQSATLEADISQQVSSLDAPPVNFNLNLGYQSNIDLVDQAQYKDRRYLDNGIINIGAATAINTELMDMPLSYNPSLAVMLLEDNDYKKSSDVVRDMKISNSLFLNVTSDNEKLAFGPTLELSAQKKYTYPGYHRKRDNLSSAIGLRADLKAAENFSISSAASVGYLDHSGNYKDQNSAFRAFEHNLQEDRAIYKGSITPVFMISPAISFSAPVSYMRENYTQKRAHASIISSDNDQDLATWTTSHGVDYMDEALEQATTSGSLNADIKMGIVAANLGYNVTNINELNKGQSSTDQDIYTYSLGLSAAVEAMSFGLAYSNEDIKYRKILGGGGKDITQTYSANVVIPKVIDEIDATFTFAHTNYQESLPNDGPGGSEEEALDNLAMVGITTTL